MMHMTFYWGKQVTVLFDSWKTDTYLSYFITLFALFISSVFYQYLEDKRIRFKIGSSAKKVVNTSVETPLLAKLGAKKSVEKYGSAVLFGVNSAIGYMLMLAIMSFNGGVFVAVVLGLSFGYLFFRCGEEEVVMLENPCACA